METIGDKIKKLRNAKRLSLKELADRVNLSNTGLSKIETGKTKTVTIEIGKRLCEALDVSFNELFEILPDNQAGEKNKIEVETLRKRVSELEYTVDVTRKLDRFQKDSQNFMKQFGINALVILAENPDIKAHDLWSKNISMIENEMGKVGVTLDPSGNLNIVFQTKEEEKLLKKEIEKLLNKS